jgi:hypothetical protein
MHAAGKIKERKEETRRLAWGRDVCFLRGSQASRELRPIGNGEFGAQRLQGLRSGRRGAAFEVEEYGGIGTQRTERACDQEAKLFFAEAAGHVGGAEAKNQVEELLAELADFGVARDGERREGIFAEKNGAAAANIGELGGERASGVRDFVLQEKHGMKLNSSLRDAQRLTEQVNLGLMERGKNENEIQVRGGAKFPFGGAAEEDGRE